MLEKTLLAIAKTEPVQEIKHSPYGIKYVIERTLNTPKGTSAIVETVWIIERGEQQPRFVTAYPAHEPEEVKRYDL